MLNTDHLNRLQRTESKYTEMKLRSSAAESIFLLVLHPPQLHVFSHGDMHPINQRGIPATTHREAGGPKFPST